MTFSLAPISQCWSAILLQNVVAVVFFHVLSILVGLSLDLKNLFIEVLVGFWEGVKVDVHSQLPS